MEIQNRNIIITTAEKIILDKIESLEKKINELLEKQIAASIEEISLNKASRLLHRSSEFLKNEVRSGRLRAVVYKGKNKEKKYKFRLNDIIEYQNKRATRIEDGFDGIETAEEIATRIFKRQKT